MDSVKRRVKLIPLPYKSLMSGKTYYEKVIIEDETGYQHTMVSVDIFDDSHHYESPIYDKLIRGESVECNLIFEEMEDE